jgi:hypothetical protein
MPVCSRVRSTSRHRGGECARIVSTSAALGRETTCRSFRGSFTRPSGAGFRSSPAKSSTSGIHPWLGELQFPRAGHGFGEVASAASPCSFSVAQGRGRISAGDAGRKVETALAAAAPSGLRPRSGEGPPVERRPPGFLSLEPGRRGYGPGEGPRPRAASAQGREQRQTTRSLSDRDRSSSPPLSGSG